MKLLLLKCAPKVFQELATKAHGMEMTTANCCGKLSSSYELEMDMGETKKSSKPSKALTKETMVIFAKGPTRISRKLRLKEKKGSSLRDEGRKKPTLKERQEKKYPLPDSDLSGMLDDLLESGIIELPPPKRPEEVGRTIDPKCCHYHRVISHSLEKYITLKGTYYIASQGWKNHIGLR